MPKTNEREWESKLKEKFQDFADSIVWSNDNGDEKYIGVGNMCDWWIKEMSQLELDTIARCQKEERERAANLVDKLPCEPNRWELGDCINAIRSGVTSLNKTI